MKDDGHGGVRVTHEPADDPAWQESMAFVFCDLAVDVAGTAAFGTFVPRGTGLSWLGLAAGHRPGAVLQRSRNDVALAADDRTPARIGVGGVHWEQHEPGAGLLVAVDGDAELRLEFVDDYPPTSWHDVGDASLDRLAAGHVECSGRVRGTVRVGDVEATVDGWGHRDQSWGPRTTGVVRNHRWVAGSCGPAMGFSTEALHLADGTVVTMGFVAREGVVVRATSVETLVTLDHDGLTPRHFESRVTLETGEELTIASEEILACLFNHRDPLVAIDALARVRCDGLVGFADLNLIANPQAGTTPPSRLLGGSLDDGLRVRDAPSPTG